MKIRYPHFTRGKEKQKEVKRLVESRKNPMIGERPKPGFSNPKFRPKPLHFLFSAYHNESQICTSIAIQRELCSCSIYSRKRLASSA